MMDMNLDREILEILGKIAQAGAPVRLINVYKGMPVVTEARIDNIDTRGVQFRLTPSQMVCLQLEGQSHISSESLPSVVRARLVEIDFPSGTARLNNFGYAPRNIGKRTPVRVRPTEPIPVLITSGTRRLRGSLGDISELGVGLFSLAAQTYHPGLLQRDSQVKISLRLPGDEQDIQFEGIILYLSQEEAGYHLGVSTLPGPEARQKISGYISRRLVEIKAEMERLYSEYMRDGVKL